MYQSRMMDTFKCRRQTVVLDNNVGGGRRTGWYDGAPTIRTCEQPACCRSRSVGYLIKRQELQHVVMKQNINASDGNEYSIGQEEKCHNTERAAVILHTN